MIKTTGKYLVDLPEVLSIMWWPGDRDLGRRTQSAAVHQARYTLRDPRLRSRTIEVSAGMLEALLSAPADDEFRKIEAARTRDGFVAGSVLVCMFLMDRYADRLPKRGSNGASLKKTFAMLASWGGHGGTFGDGAPWPKSDRTIRDAWQEFKSVAHLWAALYINVAFPWAPDRDALEPAHFGTFLGVAAGFQEFGMKRRVFNKATKSTTSLIGSLELWQIDAETHAVVRLRNESFDAIMGSPMIEFLKSYVG